MITLQPSVPVISKADVIEGFDVVFLEDRYVPLFSVLLQFFNWDFVPYFIICRKVFYIYVIANVRTI